MIRRDKFFTILLTIFSVSVATLIFNNIYSGVLPKLVEEINNSAIGAIITAIITVILLRHQSQSEELRDRNVKVFEEKSEKFSQFISLLWDKWSDFKIEPHEIEDVRKAFYRDVYIYLPGKTLAAVADHFDRLRPYVGCDLDKPKQESARSEIFGIINLLKAEIGLHSARDSSPDQIHSALNKIDGAFEALIERSEDVNESSKLLAVSGIIDDDVPVGGTFWHFIAYNDQNQRELLHNLSVLVLGDSDGEGDNRTRRLQTIQKGDLIFMYSKGFGYVGCFQAVDQGKSIPMEERVFIKDEGFEGQVEVSELALLPNEDGIRPTSVRRRTLERMYDRDAIVHLLKGFLDKKPSTKLEKIYKIMSTPHETIDV